MYLLSAYRSIHSITHFAKNVAGKVHELRSDFKALLASNGLGDRLGTAQVSALFKRGLLATDSPHGKLRLGVPQHALRFYFPNLWPEAEVGAQ